MPPTHRSPANRRPPGSAAFAVLMATSVALAAACSGVGAPSGSTPPEPVAMTPTPAESDPGSVAPAATWSPEVAILDPKVLAELEAGGVTLGRLVSGSPARTNAELSRLPAFASLFDVLRGDVRDAARGFPLAKVTTVDGFRLFDVRLFEAQDTSFELVGVFNRLDRRGFHDEGCGEIRFVYRLRYATTQGGAPMTGRLPMTVNVVFLADDAQGCVEAARAWQREDAKSASAWLADDSPLGAVLHGRHRLFSVETNLQGLRLQSSVSPTMAGHVDYSLRVFRPETDGTGKLAPAPMENTPDVAALKDPSMRAELIAYLKRPEVLAAVDRGTLRLPERFLATGAHSFAPRGLTRLSNRPFSQVLTPDDLEGLDLSTFATIGSPKALLRRLDGATCAGCHQSRSIAGFHFVGEDDANAPVYASLLFGTSSHLRADLERRAAYVATVARGETPGEARPQAERQGAGDGFGAPCSLGDPGLSQWRCAAGLRCEKLEDPDVGVCLDDAPIGAPCEHGVLSPKADARSDYVSPMFKVGCGEHAGCSRNISGFPLGTCASSCEGAGEEAVCADVLDVDGFQNCLRLGLPRAQCETDYVIARADRACDASHPCRQDYVCARTQHDGQGACVPPYFVFGLRLDGRPSL